jgi:hypothetical protein
MKKLFLFLIGSVMTLTVIAQYNTSTLTLVLRGNASKQILIDGRTYTTDANNSVVITDLQSGQHQLEVKGYNSYSDDVNTSFTLRDNYDKRIVITARGGLQQSETRHASVSTGTAMSSASFRTLLRSVQNQRRQANRRALVSNAFSSSYNYFTSSQVSQLLNLINSDQYRLQYAKTVYSHVTDPAGFSQVYNLLNSEASRNELEAYVGGYSNNNYGTVNNNVNGTPVSDATFNSLYQSIRNQYSESARVTAATNLFNNLNYSFTVYQAKQIISLINSESNRLSLAKLSFRGITDPNNFNQVYDLLYSQSSRNDLLSYVNTYSSRSSYSAKVSMTDADYNTIYNNVQSQWGLGAKMNTLTTVFANSNYYFTTAQASRLIELVSSESNRLQLAKSAYLHITDPANFSNLYYLLSNQSSRDELDNYVRSYNGNGGVGYNYRSAMTDNSFNSLYNDISSTWGLGAKMSRLTEVFANTSNYFTTAQAEKLIRLVSSESNRLQLAKSAYSHITDPLNFSDLYDVFSNQSSIDELKSYISQ